MSSFSSPFNVFESYAYKKEMKDKRFEQLLNLNNSYFITKSKGKFYIQPLIILQIEAS